MARRNDDRKSEPSTGRGPARPARQVHRQPTRRQARLQRLTRAQRVRRRILLWAGLPLVVILVLGSSGYLYTLYRYHQMHKITVQGLAPQVAGGPVNILLIGNNSRCVLNGKQASQFGSCAQVGGGRADVEMILHLVPSTRSLSIVSIPRDSWMPQPGHQSYEERIDAELNNGPSALVRTVEQDLGIPINHFVELNFDTFQSVVSALGGINMYFPTRMFDAYSGLNVKYAGCYHLSGTQALQVVRARHLEYGAQLQYYDPTGDIGRITRDHEFVKVLAADLRHTGLFDITRLNAVVGSILPKLTVDSSFSLGEMISLAETFHSVDPSAAPTATLPVFEDPTPYYFDNFDDGDVVFPTEPFDEQVMAKELGIIPPPVAKGTTVEVLNGVGGASSFAANLPSQLTGLGYNVVGSSSVPPPASLVETVVYYGSAAERAQAETLAGHFVGEVAMGMHAMPRGVDLEVVAGNGAYFTPTPAVSPAKRHRKRSSPASGTSSVPSTSTLPTSTTTTTVPISATFPGSIVNVTQAKRSLPWFDPRGCSTSMTPTPLTS
ncbi:MAG: LCP family protein [Acidimicrobiales bacterium]